MRYFIRRIPAAAAAAAAAIMLAGCASSAHSTAAQKPVPHTAPRQTITVIAPANYTEHSYRGRPDLGLTLAVVQAGGGPRRFNSARLFTVLAGDKAKRESQNLQHLYGKAKMAAFMETFNFAVTDLVSLFKMNGVALPNAPRLSPRNGRALTVAIYHAGIMPTGKWDCGYMMERLMTHPVHIALMHDINVARGHGPQHDANFHIILTRMIVDLRNMYSASS
jgi:hypothetical protein